MRRECVASCELRVGHWGGQLATRNSLPAKGGARPRCVASGGWGAAWLGVRRRRRRMEAMRSTTRGCRRGRNARMGTGRRATTICRPARLAEAWMARVARTSGRAQARRRAPRGRRRFRQVPLAPSGARACLDRVTSHVLLHALDTQRPRKRTSRECNIRNPPQRGASGAAVRDRCPRDKGSIPAV